MPRKKLPQILVVEYNDKDFAVIKQRFSSEFHLLRATTADEALQLVVGNVPEAILLSLELPETSGLEVLREIKANPSRSHIPVVMLSQEDDVITKMEAFNGGAIDYITKPFVTDEFRARVLAQIQQFQKQYYANPLSGLPGNVVIEIEIKKRIESDQPFTIFHVDLSEFKAFNDKYGYDRGDEALLLTRGVLLEAREAKGHEADFIGHIGGDDFIYLAECHECEELCQHIIDEFDGLIPSLYNKDDREQGHITSKNRKGEEETFPIMSIGLAGVTNKHKRIDDYREVSSLLSQVKKKVKQARKSVYHIDKRK